MHAMRCQEPPTNFSVLLVPEKPDSVGILLPIPFALLCLQQLLPLQLLVLQQLQWLTRDAEALWHLLVVVCLAVLVLDEQLEVGEFVAKLVVVAAAKPVVEISFVVAAAKLVQQQQVFQFQQLECMATEEVQLTFSLFSEFWV